MSKADTDSSESFRLGGIGVRARIEATGQVRYSASMGDIASGEWGGVADAIEDLSRRVRADEDRNRPLQVRSAFGDMDVGRVLASATAEDFAQARAMRPAQGAKKWKAIARSFGSRVGEAIMALAVCPPEMRAPQLHGTPLRVDGLVRRDVEEPQLITVTRLVDGVEQVYRFKTFRSPVIAVPVGQALTSGQVYDAFVLIPEKDWEHYRLLDEQREEPATPSANKTQLRCYRSLVEEFREKATSAWFNSKKSSETDLPALLAYVAGVLRWMGRNGLETNNKGLRNPWFALGLSLSGLHGLDTSEIIFHYSPSVFDTIEGIDESTMGTDLSAEEHEQVSQTDGSVN